MDSYGAQQAQLGAGEEQQDRHSFSDQDNLMTLGFSDISLPGFLHPASFLAEVVDPATPTARRKRTKDNSGSSERQGSHRTENCSLVQDDPHTEVTERRRKRRNQTITQSHNLTEKRRREKIKAKLKVLQELIPNSQKLDKTSLLDKVISRIKSLQLQHQILQGMSMNPYLFAPPMQYATTTQLSPFLSPISSNMSFGTGLNANMSTIQPHLPHGIPYSFPFWSSVAGNFMSMPSLPPNPYFQPPATSTFKQPQFPEMAPHASSDEHRQSSSFQETEGTVNGNEIMFP